MPFQLLHKTLLIFLFLFCFSTSIGFSQQTPEVKEAQKTYNSLKIAWKDKPYEELVNLFRNRKSNLDTVLMRAAANLILIKAKKENRPKYYVRAYLNLAILEDSKGNYKDAIEHINKAVKYSKDADDYRNKAGIYLRKGTIKNLWRVI